MQPNRQSKNSWKVRKGKEEGIELGVTTKRISGTEDGTPPKEKQKRRSSRPMRRRLTTEQKLEFTTKRNNVMKRGKYGKAISTTFLCLALITTVVERIVGISNPVLYYTFKILTNVFLFGNTLGLIIIGYKNISKAVLKKIYQDLNVILIIILSVINFGVECAQPSSELSPIFSFSFIVFVVTVFSFDAIEKKGRFFTLLLNLMLLSFLIIGLYDLVFGTLDVNTVLVDFGGGRIFYIRAVKRSIYIEILMLLCDGLVAMAKDSNMKLLMFASGPVYKTNSRPSMKSLLYLLI